MCALHTPPQRSTLWVKQCMLSCQLSPCICSLWICLCIIELPGVRWVGGQRGYACASIGTSVVQVGRNLHTAEAAPTTTPFYSCSYSGFCCQAAAAPGRPAAVTAAACLCVPYLRPHAYKNELLVGILAQSASHHMATPGTLNACCCSFTTWWCQSSSRMGTFGYHNCSHACSCLLSRRHEVRRCSQFQQTQTMREQQIHAQRVVQRLQGAIGTHNITHLPATFIADDDGNGFVQRQRRSIAHQSPGPSACAVYCWCD